MNIRKLSVTGKLAAIFACILIAGLAGSLVTYNAIGAAQNSVMKMTRLMKTLDTVNGYEKHFADAQAYIRTYLLTGDESRVASYREANERRAEAYSKLESETDLDKTLLTDAEGHAKAWQSAYADRQIALMERPMTVDVARALEVTGEIEDLTRELHTALAGYKSTLLTEVRNAETAQATQLQNVKVTAIVSGAVLCVLSICAGLFGYRGISHPMRVIARETGEIAQGALETKIDYASRGDEVGDLARALTVFRDNLAQNRRLEEEARETEERNRVQRKQELEALAQEFENSVMALVNRLGESASTLTSNAERLSGLADSTSGRVIEASSASEQASANVNSVADSAEQLAESVREINGQLENNARLVVETAAEAARTSTSVGELSDVVARISEVISLIQDIANQTNLLALNAAIEAARAGEAGKGFAVVASEVKALASQTAKATEQIESQIEQMQSAASASMTAVNTISGRLEVMRETASSIAAAAEEQGLSVQEIARNVSEAASGTQQVSQAVVVVRDGATQTGELGGDVKSFAEALSGDATSLRGEVDAFLSRVRAA
ncbi:methyl-accepting chemotaxis protein [Breoghania sp.]|uniref:methyl-accepting chemotaxis protein n=1 Tax=Breoghania sp. TaxID=2065378 RepID=UPI0029CA82E3|nr:methyl-accepting chemotaxis protein [Breoghania sp.]